MDWDAIGAIGEILGAAAVVVTLIYFGKQLTQANRISTVTGARELQQMYTHVYTLIATNSEIRDLLTKMRDADYVVASADEHEQIDGLIPLLTGIWLTTAITHEQGLIDAHMYKIYCEDVEVKLSKWPGLKPHVRNFAGTYSSNDNHEIFKPLYQ